MAKRIFGAPITNIINRQYFEKQNTLTESEQKSLLYHSDLESSEMCFMGKYHDKIMKYYESLDTVFTFIEKDITFEMRSLLADWLISCSMKLKLNDETYFLALYLVDRFLSERTILINKLQLVGITALVIASKYEEILCPELNSYVNLCDKLVTECEIKRAEKYMLHSLNYKLEYVSPLIFLRRVSKANNYEPKSRKMGKYFLELMMLYPVFMKYTKNVLGTTAMYLARKICNQDSNKNLLFYYSKLTKMDLKKSFDDLVKVIYEDVKYENLENKYADVDGYNFSGVARAYAKKYFK